jgi:hypothetical protein
MADLSVNRTLVKSPPELWNEVSEVETLARHLGEFGQIAISRLDPEHTVAWEGEHARGTVELEESGWGTKVTLSAELEVSQQSADSSRQDVGVVEAPVAEPEPEPSEPEPEPEPLVEIRLPWYRRWFGRPAPEPEIESEAITVEPVPEPKPEPEEPETVVERERAVAVLEDTLDHLGAAHHRPFSREG